MPDGMTPLFGGGRLDAPTAMDAERAIIDGLMGNPKNLDRVSEIVQPKHFSFPIHARIFAEQVRLIQAGGVANAINLDDWFRGDPDAPAAGGRAYLLGLVGSCPGPVGLKDYAKAVVECWERREVLAAAHDLQEIVYDREQDVRTSTAGILQGLDEALAAREGYKTTSLDGAMDAAIEAMEQARNRHGPAGISTGFTCIDDRLGGLEPGLVYVVAGRPGMGKSSLGHQIALSAARAGVGVLEISLEMSAMQLGRRALSAASGVPLFAMKSGHLTNEQAQRLVRARKEFGGLPLTIDDAGGQTPAMIAAKARLAKRKHGLGLLMIDHLNLMRAEEADAKHGGTWATGRASNTVLQIAKDCGCPVLLLAQLNRGPENRDDKRPTLADLRQAGDIEQDAYAVGFVYRPEYYLGGEPEPKDGEAPQKLSDRRQTYHERKSALVGVAEVIWQKVRDGETGTDQMQFDGPTTTFKEIEAAPYGY